MEHSGGEVVFNDAEEAESLAESEYIESLAAVQDQLDEPARKSHTVPEKISTF